MVESNLRCMNSTPATGKSTGSPLPDRVVNHDVVVVSSSSELSDTELYTLDEINIHGGPYCVDTSNVPTEDERGAVVISSEEDADSQVNLLTDVRIVAVCWESLYIP